MSKGESMAVKAGSLETPGVDLQDRAVRASAPMPGPGRRNAEDELEQLRERLRAARVMGPEDDPGPGTQKRGMHCRDCWNRGRDAAVALIEGEA